MKAPPLAGLFCIYKLGRTWSAIALQKLGPGPRRLTDTIVLWFFPHQPLLQVLSPLF